MRPGIQLVQPRPHALSPSGLKAGAPRANGWIELADFYGWAGAFLDDDLEGCKPPVFSIEDNALVLEFPLDSPMETQYIEAEDLWQWIFEEHFPVGLASHETVFGVPKVVDHDLVVTFASSTEGSPRDWATPPACLAEWKQAS